MDKKLLVAGLGVIGLVGAGLSGNENPPTQNLAANIIETPIATKTPEVKVSDVIEDPIQKVDAEAVVPLPPKPPLLKKQAAPVTVSEPTPVPARNCDPNYSGCIPLGISDADCASGKGNGPYYVTGPVQILGNDPHRLDGDKDGWGCENE